MGLDTSNISPAMVVRQTQEPSQKVDGKQWINPSGGQNGNNSETYLWNADVGAWELTRSVGPDTPLYPESGAMWRDTANNKTKTYDGTTWVNIGVTNHANLTNVTANQHHAKPTSTNTGSKNGGSWTLVGSASGDNKTNQSVTISANTFSAAVWVEFTTNEGGNWSMSSVRADMSNGASVGCANSDQNSTQAIHGVGHVSNYVITLVTSQKDFNRQWAIDVHALTPGESPHTHNID